MYQRQKSGPASSMPHEATDAITGPARASLEHLPSINKPPAPRSASPPPPAPPRLVPLLLLARVDAVEKVPPIEVPVLARVGERVLEAGLGGDVPAERGR